MWMNWGVHFVLGWLEIVLVGKSETEHCADISSSMWEVDQVKSSTVFQIFLYPGKFCWSQGGVVFRFYLHKFYWFRLVLNGSTSLLFHACVEESVYME